MAELRFYMGPMATGKSTLALQTAYNLRRSGIPVLLLTMHDREGSAISSRIGITSPAQIIEESTDLYALASAYTPTTLICDEAQFYSPRQVEQLAMAVDHFQIDVYAYGLMVDFRSQLFPGSARLMELADRRLELQVENRCWCGAIASQNARTINGGMVLEGDQVVVGDTDTSDTVAYELLCRNHFMAGVTRSTSRAKRERPDY